MARFGYPTTLQMYGYAVLQTAIQVKAPTAGVVQELLVEDGSKVVAGQELFKMTVGAAGAARKYNSVNFIRCIDRW